MASDDNHAYSNHTSQSLMIIIILLMTIISASSQVSFSPQLYVSFYARTCPSVYDTIRATTQSTVKRDPRMGASIIRLLFHDCFVNGCDGSVLLADSVNFKGEQNVRGNQGSLRGFEVIDAIKAQVDLACGQSVVVSCADVLAVSARDSVVELGGPSYTVPLGRRDARTATQDIRDLPAPFEDLNSILSKFSNKGFNAQEMIALSGAHTVGQSRCTSFRDRIYNETNIDPQYAISLRATCPRIAPNGDNNLAPLDPHPKQFGNSYFQALMDKRGLLHSDQILFNGGSADAIVRTYSNNPNVFSTDFANAMAKMSNLSPLTGTQGEVRVNCKRVN